MSSATHSLAAFEGTYDSRPFVASFASWWAMALTSPGQRHVQMLCRALEKIIKQTDYAEKIAK